jgi:hypothetical protein
MIQHPIPQNISAYRFRIIGDMTFKQFLLLVIPAGLIFLIFSTNLPTTIKVFIAVGLGFFGFVGAFMPIEERPLDQWFVAFIKAIYNPTQFIWRRDHSEPEYFTFSTASANLVPADSPDMAALAIKRKREGLKSFLQTLPEQKLANDLEQQENQAASSLTSLFTAPTYIPAPITPTPNSPTNAPLTSLTPQTIVTPQAPPAPPPQQPRSPFAPPPKMWPSSPKPPSLSLKPQNSPPHLPPPPYFKPPPNLTP